VTVSVIGNIIYGSAVGITSNTASSDSIVNITDNVIVSNGAIGISVPATVQALGYVISGNAFGFTDIVGVPIDYPANIGNASISLTADPFVDAAGGDFNLNNTPAGGLAIRQATIVLPD
jgi:hypothetical protein